MHKRGIIWFRQDLRLHDNEAIAEALKICQELLYVYIFDERIFNQQTSYGFQKTGSYRSNFIAQSVEELRNAIKQKGAQLIVAWGKPEEILFDLARKYRTSYIFCNRERTNEEVKVQDDLEKKLWSIGQEIRYSRGKMLLYTQDLPFPVTHTPDNFTSFRKEVEKITPIRNLIPEPDSLPSCFIDTDIGEIPTFQGNQSDIQGGEKKALKRLNEYIWGKEYIRDFKETRDNLEVSTNLSQFSPYLAQGCLSPKMLYWEIKKYEEAKGACESTYWLFYELLWRDFFRLMGKKHGNQIFQVQGYNGLPVTSTKIDYRVFRLWAEGRTGTPLVDGIMRQLNQTGYISNRARQIAASFLIYDLRLNWLMGAQYFESLLIDYDPCSNYGNWAFIAGVGSDTKRNRYYNILAQAKKYDPDGTFVKSWVKELSEVDAKHIHQLDLWQEGLLSSSLPEIYKKPLVESSAWASL